MKFLRNLLALVFVAVLAPSADGRPRGISSAGLTINGGILINISPMSFGAGYNIFLNWWKIGSNITLVSSVNGTLTGQQIWDCPTNCTTPTTYFETATGELVTPLPADVVSISRGFFAQVLWPQYQYEGTSFTNFAGQVWDVKWNGCASPTITITGTLGTGGTSSFGSNSGTITFGSSGAQNVGLTIAPTAGCFASPPKNIVISQHQYATNVANGELLNPDWLAAIKPTPPLAFLRVMDLMDTNFNSFTDSSQLADNNYNTLNASVAMADGNGSISGSTLTITSFVRGAVFASGQRIVCIGCTNTATITAQLTGTGGATCPDPTCTGKAGTYSLSGSSPATSTTILGILPVGANYTNGPKGGIAPSIACEIANKANANIEYPIPVAASNQFVTDVATAFKGCLNANLKVKFSYGNENWNPGLGNTFRYVSAQSTSNYAGFRAAQIMQLAAGVFGTTTYDPILQPTSRWVGAIGAQHATPSVASSYISGARAAIAAGPIPFTLQQLFTQVDIAPYWGAFFSGSSITGITAGATPTVTASNTFTNGQSVRLFVNGGTMASVLNNVDVTVSSATGSNFQINVATTGLTYGGSNNGAMDSAIFKLADQSTALNISTPATYPTKFAYFNQQMSKAILNGSASDASYGTITIGSSLNLAGSVSLFQQNALIAQSNGLQLGQYEGGPTQSLSGPAQSPIVPTEAVEFLNMSLFDAGVTGDTVNTSANLFATMYSQFDSVNGIYPAQFNDAGFQSQFGPWGALRFIPGDTGNVKWTAILAKNAAGVHVDPTPAATWSVNYNSSTDRNFSSGSATTLTCTYTAPSSGLAIIATSQTSVTIPSQVQIDSNTAITVPDSADTASAWRPAIWSQVVSAGAHTITVTWGSGVSNRNCAALTLTNLASTTVESAGTQGQHSQTINITKGSFIISVATPPVVAGALIQFSPSGAISGCPAACSNVSTFDYEISNSQLFAFSFTSPGPPYSSPIFAATNTNANGFATAAYK